MGQQISIEDALEAFRKRHGEVADENVLLRAQVAVLERRVEELEQQNSLLQGASQRPSPGESESPGAGPYSGDERP
ncbi:hypothetical protein [Streptomyces sp. NPDC050416]|uniref:hypothetical protein n=1 Tax=Streptomyces sp. NPDC050416 TaxID=3365611 RepID=UPI0037A1313D